MRKHLTLVKQSAGNFINYYIFDLSIVLMMKTTLLSQLLNSSIEATYCRQKLASISLGNTLDFLSYSTLVEVNEKSKRKDKHKILCYILTN